jgi:hypothetical protein
VRETFVVHSRQIQFLQRLLGVVEIRPEFVHVVLASVRFLLKVLDMSSEPVEFELRVVSFALCRGLVGLKPSESLFDC